MDEIKVTDEQFVTLSLRELSEATGLSKQSVCAEIRRRALHERRAAFVQAGGLRGVYADGGKRSLIDVDDEELYTESPAALADKYAVSRATVYRERAARGKTDRPKNPARRGKLANVVDEELFGKRASDLATEYGCHPVTVSNERRRRRMEKEESDV